MSISFANTLSLFTLILILSCKSAASSEIHFNCFELFQVSVGKSFMFLNVDNSQHRTYKRSFMDPRWLDMSAFEVIGNWNVLINDSWIWGNIFWTYIIKHDCEVAVSILTILCGVFFSSLILAVIEFNDNCIWHDRSGCCYNVPCCTSSVHYICIHQCIWNILNIFLAYVSEA